MLNNAFTAGSAIIPITVSNITSSTGLTAENFNVQYSILGSNPIAASIAIPPLTNSNTILEINMKGVEYDGST